MVCFVPSDLLLRPPLQRVDDVLLAAVQKRDGPRWTLALASGNSGFTLAELFENGDGAPPGAGVFVSRLGRLVYRLFVTANELGHVPDVHAKSVLVWNVKPAPYGSEASSFLAVGATNAPRVLVPMPRVPDSLRGRPDNVERTRVGLSDYAVSVTDAANVALLASRMLRSRGE